MNSRSICGYDPLKTISIDKKNHHILTYLVGESYNFMHIKDTKYACHLMSRLLDYMYLASE